MTLKTLMLAALTGATLATAASAGTPIDGRWNCHENMNRNGLKGTIDSVTDFRPDGTLRMTLVMNAHKLVVPIRVEATYASHWKLVDGHLVENADSATVTLFKVAGIDKTDSDYSTDFKAELMAPGTPPQVTVVSENKFELTQPGRLTTCTR